MVEFALIFGIFSYIIFGFGLLGLLGKVWWLGILGVLGGAIILAIKKRVWVIFLGFAKEVKRDRICLVLLGLLILSAIVNFIGALGPELSFDSLWYHLTIPKIYLSFGRIFYIPGNLFYYSAMPKLTEMLYLVSLFFSSSGSIAKLLHLSFGVLTTIVLFKISKKYLSFRLSLVACLIFYSTLIVGWESITAYVDLARSFFEILALERFLAWTEEAKREKIGKEEMRKLIESAIMLGLAISTKLIALASLPVFLILIFLRSKKILTSIFYLLISAFIVSPWLVFSFINTGNPVYPLFSGLLDSQHGFVVSNLFRVIRDFWGLLYHPQDLISPVFLIFLPVIFYELLRVSKSRRTSEQPLKLLTVFVFINIFFWLLTPRTGGSRFFLPYLPAFSIVLCLAIEKTKKFYKTLFVSLSIIVGIFNLGYRTMANSKYLPVILGRQSRNDFLNKNLNFNFGDFFDNNGEIAKIVGNDPVLIYGSHNLFYVDFPFIHSSFAKKGDSFSYILTQDTALPESLGGLKIVYENPKTKVNLYLFGGKL